MLNLISLVLLAAKLEKFFVLLLEVGNKALFFVNFFLKSLVWYERLLDKTLILYLGKLFNFLLSVP